MPPNTATILLAPSGAGKTEYMLRRLAAQVGENPFARVWVLLPSKRQEIAFRERLTAYDDGRHVYFNIEFFNFYELYERLLNVAGQPQRDLDDSGRTGLLRTILRQLQDARQLTIYSAIVHTPGFLRAAADFIFELKQNLVYPLDFAAVAIRRADKDRELALIYRLYQETLQIHDLVDREGEGWLALEFLRSPDETTSQNLALSPVDLLLIDGYDQFTRLQAQLIARLSGLAGETLIALSTVPERENTVGRRFVWALESLQEGFVRENQPQPIVIDFAGADQRFIPAEKGDFPSRHPAIQCLLDCAFRLQPGLEQTSASDGVIFLEAPSPALEIGAVLRRVKRLLLTTPAQPDDILIALRDWGLYQSELLTQGKVYHIPLALHYGESLAANPAITALLNILDLATNDFRRRDLLDALRSPYFQIPGLGREQADVLERLSLAQLVIGGREEWLDALSALRDQPAPLVNNDEDEAEPPLLDNVSANELLLNLQAFFDALTPPAQATIRDYVSWLEILIGPDPERDPDDDDQQTDAIQYQIRLLECVRHPSAAGIVERDLTAMHEFKRLLRSLIASQALLAAIGAENPLEWAEFLIQLQAAIRSHSINRSPGRSGRVLVTTVADARGLPHKHVFIPGLSEGIFPARTSEDPLYLDSERQAIKAEDIPLQTQAERAADDGLFYELVGLARETLTLSRPTVQDGNPWIESHLWRAAAAVFDDAAEVIRQNRIGVGAVVPAEDVASRDEAVLAAADGFNQAQLSPAILDIQRWLLTTQAGYWAHITAARRTEMRRMSRVPHDHYSGRLTDADLIQQVSQVLGGGRVWSASQFNDFGACGFRFFANRLLNLKALEEPEEGLTSAQLGSINHKILENTYRLIRQEGMTISADFVDEAVEILHQVADEVLPNAPHDYGFRQSALWQQRQVIIRRGLEALIRLDFSADSPLNKQFGSDPRKPYHLELPFNAKSGRPLSLEFRINGSAERLRLTGVIDRIDVQGRRAIVVDYKTGSTKIPLADMAGGRNFQMMLYLLAAAELLKDDPQVEQVVGGVFWHLRNRQLSDPAKRGDDETEAAIHAAREYLGRYVARARSGYFTNDPVKLDEARCAHYCDFHQLCRVNITHRRKGRGSADAVD